MWVKILHMRRDKFIIMIKKKKKGIYGTASKKDFKELSDEGIDAKILPWVDDNSN